MSQDDRMILIARCKGCGTEALVDRTMTVSAPCGCFLRDDIGWDLIEMAPADQLRGAVTDLAAAVRLLNDAQTTIIDTDLRREWEAERARLRAAVEGSNP
jgi:hypothetical protein